MRVTARQLEVFIAVAQTGKTTLAADIVGVSQAAVSMTVSELEQQLQRQLFTRERNRLELNEFGKSILPEALRSIHHIRKIESIAKDVLDSSISGSPRSGDERGTIVDLPIRG